MLREIDELTIHCSATKNGAALFEGRLGEPGFRTPVEAIDAWHARRGLRRALAWRMKMNEPLASIGYHYVIYVAGTIVTGRHPDEAGAHVRGNNRRSLGACLLGTDRFTMPQWASLAALVESWKKRVPHLRVRGHRDCSPDQDDDGLVEPWEWLKICPGFDVAAWIAGGLLPPPQHVFTPHLKEPA